ncbi:unnamed protein product, partial [Ectocarpus sp. 12 AP-2014]
MLSSCAWCVRVHARMNSVNYYHYLPVSLPQAFTVHKPFVWNSSSSSSSSRSSTSSSIMISRSPSHKRSWHTSLSYRTAAPPVVAAAVVHFFHRTIKYYIA